jgi:UDP-glucose 4-epimerase
MKNIQPFEKNKNFRFSKADVCHWKEIEKAVLWADRIYHLTANLGQKKVLANPLETIKNNIRGCEVVLEAIHSTKSKARILLTSTSEVYYHSDRDSEGRVKEDTFIKFPSGKFRQESYPLSKLVNEVMLLGYAHAFRIHCVVARVFNTIGVNQCSTYGMVVPTFVEQALTNQPLTVFGDGKQARSFSDVRDTVKALTLLMESPKSKGEIVNVGNDSECSINDLAKLVKEITNSSSEVKYLTYQEAYGVDEFEDVRRRRPDLTKLKELTGFTHSYTLKETLKEILKSLRL